MSNSVFVKKYQASEISPVDLREALRYAGNKTQDESVVSLITQCIMESYSVLEYKVCYMRTELVVDGDRIIFPFGEIVSFGLGRNLKGCKAAVLFGATIGIGMDRLITKNSMLLHRIRVKYICGFLP